MKQRISSPYRKMRVLFVLPVMALLMYAFAEPAYDYVASGENSRQGPEEQQQSEKMVRGRAAQQTSLRAQSAIRTNTIDDSTLILVDGIKTSKINMYTINASDIESISVIKSREAVRTYAEEGITSVILITTKKSE